MQPKLSLETSTQILKNQPDIVAFDSFNNSSIELDVSMVHPLSGDTVKFATVETGYAAKEWC